jgi:hypothetical protein
VEVVVLVVVVVVVLVKNHKEENQMTTEGTSEQPSSARPGPRTPQGKLRAKYNRIQNGIFARIVLKGEPFRESKKDYAALLVSLRDAIQPIGGLEELLVEKLAFLALRLSRLYKADAKVAPLLFGAIEKSLTEKSSLPVIELMNWQKEITNVPPDLHPHHALRLHQENLVVSPADHGVWQGD